MATEKRLIDAIKHRLECHIAKAVYFGVDNIPTGKDSSSAFEFLRGYERGATETANIVLGMIPVDAVEVVHGRWEQVQCWATKAKYRCSVCGRTIMSAVKVNIEKYPYCHCGARMDGDGNA